MGSLRTKHLPLLWVNWLHELAGNLFSIYWSFLIASLGFRVPFSFLIIIWPSDPSIHFLFVILNKPGALHFTKKRIENSHFPRYMCILSVIVPMAILNPHLGQKDTAVNQTCWLLCGPMVGIMRLVYISLEGQDLLPSLHSFSCCPFISVTWFYSQYSVTLV